MDLGHNRPAGLIKKTNECFPVFFVKNLPEYSIINPMIIGMEGGLMKLCNLKQIRLIILISIFLCWTYVVQAEQPGWQRQEVDWLAGPGGRIKAIRYPQGKDLSAQDALDFRLFTMESADVQSLNTIDSPPIAGFVPQIAVAVTDKRSDDFDWIAQPRMSVTGNYLTNNPETDFVIGLLDTGASSSIISNAGANVTGIFSSDLVIDRCSASVFSP